MTSLVSENELNAYLQKQKVRDADLATLHERLEEKIEEWFYEFAVLNGWYDENEDEPTITWYAIDSMSLWNHRKWVEALPLAERRKRLRRLWKERMDRARIAYPKTYENHPEVYDELLAYFQKMADTFTPDNINKENSK